MSIEVAAALSVETEAQIQAVIGAIDGQVIDEELLELAAINGERLEPTADHPIRFATNRLALSPADTQARTEFIKPRMYKAGMDVYDDHPLAIIGSYPGRRPELAPVLVLSHIDTVNRGDRYDGVLGVAAALHALQIMHDRDIHPERNILTGVVTGEESAPFNIALFGSLALWKGLNSDELGSRKEGGPSIREVLGETAARRVSEPHFGPHGSALPAPYAAVELHVEQNKRLLEEGYDLGVVHSIAAPVRYRATVGETPLAIDAASYAHERYLRLTVHGNQDHSGATPMGYEHRADGLLETAVLLEDFVGQSIAVGNIEVADAAMNKIPGETTTILRIASDSEQTVAEKYRQLQVALEQRGNLHADSSSLFPAEAFTLREINKAEAGEFFASPEMAARQKAAFNLIRSVHGAASGYAQENVVGTVASFMTRPDGTISLEVDIRGIDLETRNSTVRQVERDMRVDTAARITRVALGEPLPGSGEPPVTLDPRLVDRTLNTIRHFDIGSVNPMFSAAGHDTQNAAKAGVPSVMIFCQSKNGAHNPDAYTSPANMEQGAQAQAALMLRLANETG